MVKRITLPLALLVALMLPAAALAKKIEVDGATTLQAKGPLRAELKSGDGTEPILIRGQRGILRVIDLGGDAKVECRGKGKSRSRKNEQGQTVYVCAGRGGRASVAGSHVRIVAFAMRMQLAIPDGWSGTVQGRVRERGQDAGAADEQKPKPVEDGQGSGEETGNAAPPLEGGRGLEPIGQQP